MGLVELGFAKSIQQHIYMLHEHHGKRDKAKLLGDKGDEEKLQEAYIGSNAHHVLPWWIRVANHGGLREQFLLYLKAPPFPEHFGKNIE